MKLKTLKDFLERAKEVHKEHLIDNDKINKDKGENWRCEVSLADGYLHGKELLVRLLKQEAIKHYIDIRKAKMGAKILGKKLEYSAEDFIEDFFNIDKEEVKIK